MLCAFTSDDIFLCSHWIDEAMKSSSMVVASTWFHMHLLQIGGTNLQGCAPFDNCIFVKFGQPKK
jgi:hypothetical protein